MSKRRKLLFELNKSGHGKGNPVLLRILLYPDYTKVDFGYTTSELYVKGGWVKIAGNTYIENTATKERVSLVRAEGITIAPEKKKFTSKKDWQYYSLYFGPLEQQDQTLHIIEKEKGSANDFNYYNIELKMAEAAELIEIV